MLNEAHAGPATPSPVFPEEGRQYWYCVRTKPKHEHIAAAHIKMYTDAEVFLPRIRFERQSRRGKMKVVEPLFPNYLFARLDLYMHLAMVRYAAGVQTVIHFGTQIPIIPDQIIQDLVAELDSQGIGEADSSFHVGDQVEVIEGAFMGFSGLVTRVIPARARVAILLEFLGRQTMVEVPTITLLRPMSPAEAFALRRKNPPST